MVLSSLRWMALVVLLYVFKRAQIAADWNAMRQRLGYLLLMGAVGFTGFSVSLYYALVYTTAINASILQGSMPLFVFSASFILFGSAVTRAQALGFVCSFMGVIVIAARGELHNLIALQVNIGDALMFVAVLSYGVYTAALRTKPQLHWTSLMFILSLGASLASLPLLALEISQGSTIWPDRLGWIVIIYIIIFPSLLSQVFYIRAVELIGSNRAGLFINLLPLWGALLAITVVKETFHSYHGVALAMIMLGIAFAEYGSRRHAGKT